MITKDQQSKEDKMEGFRALAFLIKESARLDSNPNIGRLYPKGDIRN